MRKSLKKILAEPDDFELCSALFDRIIGYHGEEIDPCAISEPEQVVLLVWHVSGIIGNGGFHYLFEGDLKGDPCFALTARAFQIAGCKKAAEAVQKALAIFPNSRPQRDIGERLAYYLKRCKSGVTDLDLQFFAANDELNKSLASYVRMHSDAFNHLDHAKRQKKLKMASEVEEESQVESEEYRAIHGLPKWARVAFAAHCARQVLPLLSRNWPNIPPRHSKGVKFAVELAELSAAEGQARPALEKAILGATRTAGAASGAAALTEKKSRWPENAYLGDNAACVARAAERAAESARTDGEDSLMATLEALHYAASSASASDEPAFVEILLQDLAFLRRAALRGKWNNQTKVPPEIWEMR